MRSVISLSDIPSTTALVGIELATPSGVRPYGCFSVGCDTAPPILMHSASMSRRKAASTASGRVDLRRVQRHAQCWDVIRIHVPLSVVAFDFVDEPEDYPIQVTECRHL